MKYRLSFREGTHPSIELEENSNLSECLNIDNSPVLFGCRTGICGTCLIEVDYQKNGALHPPSEDEKDLLSILTDENPKARLACQVRICADIEISPIKR